MRMGRRGGIVMVAAVATLIAAGQAYAGFGAVAYDQNTGKYGSSFDVATQALAYEQALRQCASPGCTVHPVEPKGCGALAISDKDKAWGGADRDKLDAAKREAVEHCKTHTETGTCTVRISGCNK